MSGVRYGVAVKRLCASCMVTREILSVVRWLLRGH